MVDFKVLVAFEDALEFAYLPDVDAAAFAVYYHFLVSVCLFVDVLRAKEAALIPY